MDKNTQVIANALVQNTVDMTQELQDFFMDYLKFSFEYCAPYLMREMKGEADPGERPSSEAVLKVYLRQLIEENQPFPEKLREFALAD